jgi:hypothetical protein
MIYGSIRSREFTCSDYSLHRFFGHLVCYTDSMNDDLNLTARKVGDALIDISALLAAKMEKWSEVSKRPNDLGDTECVGFINREAATAGLNLVVDVQAPAIADKATLRIWCLESKLDSSNIERFNNIQLDFDIDYSQARAVTQKRASATRDDIRTALHEESTRLVHILVSNQAGLDKTSQQTLGERYDVTMDDASEEASATAIASTLEMVLAALSKSAAAEK